MDTITKEDHEIVSRVLNGEKRLFEQLIRRHNASMYRIGMSILNNETDVEDVMQTAYVNAYEHLKGFEHRAAFGTWLKRILLNECFMQLKRRKRTVGDEALLASQAAAKESPVNRVINKEFRDMLENTLLTVPEKYRVVFVLREMEDLSTEETAELLDLSVSNVKTRLSRAKVMLQEKISSYYKNDTVFPLHLSNCDRIVYQVMKRLGIPG